MKPAVTMQFGDQIARVFPWALALTLASLAISAALYHPYYFGDELFSFSFAPTDGPAFATVFGELNAYKPRVVMNLLWATIVAHELPRWVPMLVNALAMSGCAMAAARLAAHAGASFRAAMAVATLVLLSRFNLMLYYDYVSGTVETLSLLFFLAAMNLLAPALFRGSALPGARWLWGGLCLTLAVLTHERYAAIAGGAIGAHVLLLIRSGGRWLECMRAVLLVVIPAALFALLVKLWSPHSLTMGTSGQEISVGMQTMRVALTYVSNVFLGANFGPPWFVGALNQDHADAPTLFWGFGVSLAAAWIWPWLVRRPTAMVPTRATFALLGGIAGAIVVASLPGPDRQEARWMFPAYTLLLVLLSATYRRHARLLLLGLLVCTQAYYLIAGRLQTIASISASQSAARLGGVASSLQLPGRATALVAMAEPDTSWILGGEGDVFCRVNLSRDNCLVVERAVRDGRTAVSSGIMPSPEGPPLTFLSRGYVEGLLEPAAAVGAQHILGAEGMWQRATFDDPHALRGGRLILDRLAENFISVPAQDLHGKLLVYRARALDGVAVPMRLQINWHSHQGFMRAQLQVVSVGPQLDDYAILALAPEGATTAYIYLTLHDGAQGRVELTTVKTVEPRDAP